MLRLENGYNGESILYIPRSAEPRPVTVGKEEFQQAIHPLAQKILLTGTPRETAEQTFQLDPLSGNYLYLPRDKKLVPMGPGAPWEGTLTKEDLDTAERYRLWCREVLVAAIGVALVLYVGYSTLYHLISGWSQLMEEVKVATTFEQSRSAGERFGRMLGTESARALVMLVMAAIGQTAQVFAATLPTLPGSADVAMLVEAQVGVSLPAVAAVQEFAVTAEGVRVVLPDEAGPRTA